jgi:hypothetical protein
MTDAAPDAAPAPIPAASIAIQPNLRKYDFLVHKNLNTFILLASLRHRGINNYIGDKTKAAACIGCLCFFIPGVIILLCPLDERDAYKVKGSVYDAGGQSIGVKFVPKQSNMSR